MRLKEKEAGLHQSAARKVGNGRKKSEGRSSSRVNKEPKGVVCGRDRSSSPRRSRHARQPDPEQREAGNERPVRRNERRQSRSPSKPQKPVQSSPRKARILGTKPTKGTSQSSFVSGQETNPTSNTQIVTTVISPPTPDGHRLPLMLVKPHTIPDDGLKDENPKGQPTSPSRKSKQPPSSKQQAKSKVLSSKRRNASPSRRRAVASPKRTGRSRSPHKVHPRMQPKSPKTRQARSKSKTRQAVRPKSKSKKHGPSNGVRFGNWRNTAHPKERETKKRTPVKKKKIVAKNLKPPVKRRLRSPLDESVEVVDRIDAVVFIEIGGGKIRKYSKTKKQIKRTEGRSTRTVEAILTRISKVPKEGKAGNTTTGISHKAVTNGTREKEVGKHRGEAEATMLPTQKSGNEQSSFSCDNFGWALCFANPFGVDKAAPNDKELNQDQQTLLYDESQSITSQDRTISTRNNSEAGTITTADIGAMHLWTNWFARKFDISDSLWMDEYEDHSTQTNELNTLANNTFATSFHTLSRDNESTVADEENTYTYTVPAYNTVASATTGDETQDAEATAKIDQIPPESNVMTDLSVKTGINEPAPTSQNNAAAATLQTIPSLLPTPPRKPESSSSSKILDLTQMQQTKGAKNRLLSDKTGEGSDDQEELPLDNDLVLLENTVVEKTKLTPENDTKPAALATAPTASRWMQFFPTGRWSMACSTNEEDNTTFDSNLSTSFAQGSRTSTEEFMDEQTTLIDAKANIAPSAYSREQNNSKDGTVTSNTSMNIGPIDYPAHRSVTSKTANITPVDAHHGQSMAVLGDGKQASLVEAMSESPSATLRDTAPKPVFLSEDSTQNSAAASMDEYTQDFSYEIVMERKTSKISENVVVLHPPHAIPSQNSICNDVRSEMAAIELSLSSFPIHEEDDTHDVLVREKDVKAVGSLNSVKQKPIKSSSTRHGGWLKRFTSSKKKTSQAKNTASQNGVGATSTRTCISSSVSSLCGIQSNTLTPKTTAGTQTAISSSTQDSWAVSESSSTNAGNIEVPNGRTTNSFSMKSFKRIPSFKNRRSMSFSKAGATALSQVPEDGKDNVDSAEIAAPADNEMPSIPDNAGALDSRSTPGNSIDRADGGQENVATSPPSNDASLQSPASVTVRDQAENQPVDETEQSDTEHSVSGYDETTIDDYSRDQFDDALYTDDNTDYDDEDSSTEGDADDIRGSRSSTSWITRDSSGSSSESRMHWDSSSSAVSSTRDLTAHIKQIPHREIKDTSASFASRSDSRDAMKGNGNAGPNREGKSSLILPPHMNPAKASKSMEGSMIFHSPVKMGQRVVPKKSK